MYLPLFQSFCHCLFGPFSVFHELGNLFQKPHFFEVLILLNYSFEVYFFTYKTTSTILIKKSTSLDFQFFNFFSTSFSALPPRSSALEPAKRALWENEKKKLRTNF